MKYLWIVFFTLIFALPAAAAPTKLAQQGRVLDGDGAPLEGSHEMVFVLYNAPRSGELALGLLSDLYARALKDLLKRYAYGEDGHAIYKELLQNASSELT